MIVMIDERFDLRFHICREEVVFQQDAVFQGLMPSLDLALSLRMIWGTPDVAKFSRYFVRLADRLDRENMCTYQI